jgi:hypothetical protein
MEGISAGWRRSSYSGNNSGQCVEVASWRKASYSGNNGGGCVEAGVAEVGRVLVRDTTNREGGTLSFTAAAWRAFATEIKRNWLCPK